MSTRFFTNRRDNTLIEKFADARSALCQERGMLFDADAPSAIATFMAGMKKLPIPDATPEQQAPIVALVDRILAAKAADPSADISALESEINLHVHALYHLAPEEIAILEGR